MTTCAAIILAPPGAVGRTRHSGDALAIKAQASEHAMSATAPGSPFEARHEGGGGGQRGEEGNGDGGGNQHPSGGEASSGAGGGQGAGHAPGDGGGNEQSGRGQEHGGGNGYESNGNGDESNGNGDQRGGDRHGEPIHGAGPTGQGAGGMATVTGVPVSVPVSAAPTPVQSTPAPGPIPVTVVPTPSAPTPTPTPVKPVPPEAGSATFVSVPGSARRSSGSALTAVFPLSTPGAAPLASIPVAARRATGFPPTASPVGPIASLPGGGASASSAASHPRPRIGTAGTHTPAEPVQAIARFIRIVPTAVWIALAAALAMALFATAAAVRSGRRARQRLGEVAEVTTAALTDPLTGLLNRRGFTAAVDQELKRARRYERPLALAFVDIRGLKAVNDSQGHLAGDRLLRDVAQLLADSARTYDVVGRIGGDELAILLPEQDAGGAAALTGRIRAKIPYHRTSLGFDATWDLTIGTSVFPKDGEDFEQLLATADRRLYEQRGIHIR